jgi:FkbM family methyltransferase
MYEFSYPRNCKVYVTDETVNIAPVTFSKNGSYFEPESIDYFFSLVEQKPGDINVVDVGAQVGLYTLYAKNLPNVHFYSFEPNLETFNVLNQNCILNNINNVTLFNKGLGENSGILDLLIPHNPEEKGLCCFTKTPIRFNSFREEQVEVTTLDDIFYNNNKSCDFIKCDTEGYELRVLKGGYETLKKYKPELFIEVCDANLRQCNITKEELFGFLYDLGYKFITNKDNENFHFRV